MYKFEKLHVWNDALDYLDSMYKLAAELPDSEKYNLKSQLRRAATSICLNIAEGSTGQTDKEQNRFLGFAIRSVIETVAVLRIVKRRNYIEKPTILDQYDQESQTLIRKLQAFRKKLATDNQFKEPEEPYGEI